MRVARSLLLPLLLLAVALGITWLIWDHEREATRLRLREQFDFSLREAVHSIERRMLDHEQMLRGVQGLLATSDGLDREVFHGYVGSLQIGADFSGIQAIGYAELVPNAHKEAHVAGMRRLGFAGYAIRPEGLRESHAPNTQIEPDVDHNRVELGFDAWADPVRRRAMEAARDSGKTAISGKVRMAMDGGGGMRPGVIMYMPIYAGG